jgi:hypothetical protein
MHPNEIRNFIQPKCWFPSVDIMTLSQNRYMYRIYRAENARDIKLKAKQSKAKQSKAKTPDPK